MNVLQDSDADILINYLPVGSTDATKYYAQCALDSNMAFINLMPFFIASSPEWQLKYQNNGLPITGDDIMSQLGATVLYKSLIYLFIY